MTAPLHSTRRLKSLGTVIPPLVIVIILLAETIHPASSQEPVVLRGAISPLPSASLRDMSQQDVSLQDDGWRRTKMGWQKRSSWNVRSASHQVFDRPYFAGPASYHPAMMAVWMLATSLAALRLFPFQACPAKKEQKQTAENLWSQVLQRMISGSRSVKVDPICGRSLF